MRAAPIAMTGEAIATVREKAVTSCPATASLTARSAAISGMTPAIT
jgi:hypothetical protein